MLRGFKANLFKALKVITFSQHFFKTLKDINSFKNPN